MDRNLVTIQRQIGFQRFGSALTANVLRLAVWCGISALNIANINKILIQDYFSKEARTPH